MCGLFASLGLPPDPSRIDVVAHRGPDGRGWRVLSTPAGPLALGHRRLAIIDTSDAGLQPFDEDSGRRSILLNGEIYNYLELRSELQADGIRFRTGTDTEVLLQALIHWGASALPRLVGMFAFVLWDNEAKTLFAARDRFGIKPLYFVQGPTFIALGSEIKQLVKLPGATGRANPARLRDFLAAGISNHSAETLFDGINQIGGGEMIVVNAGGKTPVATVGRWHEPKIPEQLSLSHSEAAERFRHLFDQSIRLHMRSDVAVGSCLSGGLDSSSIVASVSHALTGQRDRDRFMTVSAVYPGTNVNESEFAEAVACHTGFRGVMLTPDPLELLDNLKGIIHSQDEPFGSTSILSQWVVFQAAKREGIKVMLDGQGADEVLAGYPWLGGFRMLELVKEGRLIELARFLSERASLGATANEKLSLAGADMQRLAGRFAPRWAQKFVQLKREKAINGAWLVDQKTDVPTGKDMLNQRFLLTYQTNLPMLLQWEDRNSMAHGIEARVPFLDHRLVEFGLSLGSDSLFHGALTKTVLRNAMQHRLPPTVASRRGKLGFATPESDWLRGALRPAIEVGVEEAIQRFPELLEPKATRAFRDRQLNGNRSMDFALWRIANAGLWGREFQIAL
jgi:asparagine synthase (glutamine-hydrolysing)